MGHSEVALNIADRHAERPQSPGCALIAHAGWAAKHLSGIIHDQRGLGGAGLRGL